MKQRYDNLPRAIVANGKITNPNIVDRDSQQKAPTVKTRSRLQTDTLEPLSDKKERIAKEFNEWTADIRAREQFQEKKWAYRMSDFKREKGIQYDQWKKWYANKENGFAAAVVDGKDYLGTHLWAGMAEGSLLQTIAKDLHHYSEDFIENDNYEDEREIKKIKARAEATQPPQNLTINVNDGKLKND